mmetsp:Transcript_60264/g.100014  ORF Transcript_60264/g.100014 Transcript_60264/m.100014 type:complete len:227 (-) Transcript_60264:433-1113(-)
MNRTALILNHLISHSPQHAPHRQAQLLPLLPLFLCPLRSLLPCQLHLQQPLPPSSPPPLPWSLPPLLQPLLLPSLLPVQPPLPLLQCLPSLFLPFQPLFPALLPLLRLRYMRSLPNPLQWPLPLSHCPRSPPSHLPLPPPPLPHRLEPVRPTLTKTTRPPPTCVAMTSPVRITLTRLSPQLEARQKQRSSADSALLLSGSSSSRCSLTKGRCHSVKSCSNTRASSR